MVRAVLGLMALAWLLASPAKAADKLFANHAPPLRITLTGPFTTMARQARYSIKPHPATLTVINAAGAAQSFPIQVRARGVSRRKVYCSFPPIMLIFDKRAMKGSLFHGQGHLKLVPHCRGGTDYEQRIILEYLIYKLYNLVTPLSFRVRAAEVTYREDPADRGLTRFAFLLEDIDKLAGRNERERLKGPSRFVSLDQLDPHAATRVAIFEYMIGNLDWEFLASAAGESCCHNMRLVGAPGAKPATATGVTPVPYDFHFSGFVDSPYAGPAPGIPIGRLTERYFRGYCTMSGEIPAVAEEYLSHRMEMKALIDSEPGLDAHFRDKADRFMDGFFAVLGDPARLQSQLIAHCR